MKERIERTKWKNELKETKQEKKHIIRKEEEKTKRS